MEVWCCTLKDQRLSCCFFNKIGLVSVTLNINVERIWTGFDSHMARAIFLTLPCHILGSYWTGPSRSTWANGWVGD